MVVALPSSLKSKMGEDVFVRIMDDLATTEEVSMGTLGKYSMRGFL